MAKKPAEVQGPTKKYMFKFPEGEYWYRGEVKDEMGNKVEIFLVYDIDLIESRSQREALKEQSKQPGVKTYAPGEVFELEEANTKAPFNAAAIMSRAGILKEA